MKKISEKKEPAVKIAPKVPLNLSLNEVTKLRGLSVAREMGYNASELFEKLLEKLWEARRRIPHRNRGDHLQITLFDQVTPPPEEKPPTKAGK